MSNPLTDLLAEKGTLLADGATGTNLFNMGLMSGDAPEMWNTEQPQNIIKLYQGAVQSGSDIFLTNSFGANASRLKLHSAEKRAHELSRVSAELAREVADKAGRKVIVAGSVGPTGEIMEPVGPLTHALAVEMFHTADGRLLVNELAPRPHNSGHWTLDACATSQFEQLVRAICGLPLGAVDRHADAVMTNLIGTDAETWPDLLAEPGARLHLYGKAEARPGRKMGHVTRLTPKTSS